MSNNFLYMAETTIKNKQQWDGCETVTLWESGPMQVYLKNHSGFIKMTFFIEAPGKKLTDRFYAELTVGILNPERGWLFSRDSEHNYESWIRKVKESSAYRRVVATPAQPLPATPVALSDIKIEKQVNGSTGNPTFFPTSAFHQ